MQIILDLPQDLQASLTEQATQLNISIETLILQAIRTYTKSPEILDPDDDPTETVIEGIRQGWHEAMTGQTYPIAQLWDGIDAD